MNEARSGGRGRPHRGDRGGRGDERGRRRAGRMRRGDIRTSLLVTLSEQPGHGYEVIQTIEAKSNGAWKPSPGSVYPTLQMLEDEGLLSSTEQDGKRVYEITDEGRVEAEARTAEAGGAPWEVAGGPGGHHGELKKEMGQLFLASKQIAITGDDELSEKAIAIVKDARKQIYQLLADA